MTIGHSDYTTYKQMHLGQILQTHLKICAAITSRNNWANKQYNFIDLNSGPGFYENFEGSPIIFMNALNNVPQLKCNAIFFEIEDDDRTKLIKNLQKYLHRPNLTVAFLGDHNKFLPGYLGEERSRSRKEFGLLYADPNGKLPNFPLLAQFFRQKSFSTLDVLIYFTATNFKRQLKADHCPLNKSLAEILATIDKRHWIVREPYGRHQWTFLLGTNWSDFPALEKIGFYRGDRGRGQEIFNRLNFTSEEMPRETIRPGQVNSLPF